MRFLLVSAENPKVQKEIEIPDEMVKQIRKRVMPHSTTRGVKKRASPKSIKRVQQTQSII